MGISNESKKNKEALTEALKEAIGEIINPIKKGTNFTTQDIIRKLNDKNNPKYYKIYIENKELFEEVSLYHASIGQLMSNKSKEYSIAKDGGKVTGENVNKKKSKSQVWIKQ